MICNIIEKSGFKCIKKRNIKRKNTKIKLCFLIKYFFLVCILFAILISMILVVLKFKNSKLFFSDFINKNSSEFVPKKLDDETNSKECINSDLDSNLNLNVNVDFNVDSNKTNKSAQKLNYKLYENAIAYLTIPVINMYNAPISDKTTQEVMSKYIGHFDSTSYDEGNIGLASHNRGNEACYFANLNKLKIGDDIIYKYDGIKSMYKVEKIVVIDNYDWSYLENTTEDKLTLITCINNKPNFRLCVQAIKV